MTTVKTDLGVSIWRDHLAKLHTGGVKPTKEEEVIYLSTLQIAENIILFPN